MAVPEYIKRIRRFVGHDLLWLPSVSAVVCNEAGELLLGKRADDGRWSVISGFVEPDEQPAEALVREVFEETGVRVAPERVSSVLAHPHTYPNGDRCQFLNIGFRCRLIEGVARVNDDESVAVGWFAQDELPPLDAHARTTIAHALAPATVGAWYAPDSSGLSRDTPE
ncbi:NUDIX hydrolase [Plantactinospora sp. WMMC1484]|uniref:NUDIX hydrolase n=1 Tax=Plantactinospora sp. WMMC1484 TaxID=3404122 RepID=UPI003BF4C989